MTEERSADFWTDLEAPDAEGATIRPPQMPQAEDAMPGGPDAPEDPANRRPVAPVPGVACPGFCSEHVGVTGPVADPPAGRQGTATAI
jgi:hypothetical protein